MPSTGEVYKHKQIKDARYKVERVSSKNETVHLRNTAGRKELLSVTFAQLASNYERV